MARLRNGAGQSMREPPAGRLTDRSEQVLGAARVEAARLWHDYLGTEHLLLGLMLTASEVLDGRFEGAPATIKAIRRSVETRVPRGKTQPGPGVVPLTSRAKVALSNAAVAAGESGREEVEPEDLVEGLLREGKGIAAQVLRELEVSARKFNGPRGREIRFQIRIDDESGLSIYEQIVSEVQEASATRQLSPGDRLPPVRTLADQLDIAPGTVARAYRQLERLGVVTTEGARGTRVAERKRNPSKSTQASETLVGLLRPVAVAAYHMGASAQQLRSALDGAMDGILSEHRDGR